MPVSSDDTSPPLPDLGDAVFNHGGVTEPVIDNIFARGEVDNAWANIRSLVAAASSTEMILSTHANFTAVSNLVEVIRSTIVNNILRRADEPLNIALTQRHVADELLALVALLVERDNVTATVEDVLEFVV